MPAPLAIPLIGAASSLVGGAANSAATADQNRDSQRFSLAMYERTKADNLAFWNLQNDYNSPQSQMQRFEQAGLNKHLVYGQGSPGQAASIPTPDVQTPQFRSPEWGNAISASGLTLMNSIYDLDIKQAQVDNLRSQNTVIQQDALLKAAQLSGTQTRTERERFNLDFESELRSTSADARREQLRQTRTTTDLAINEDARRASQNASSLREAAERMLSMRAQRGQTDQTTLNLKQVQELQELELKLRRNNINPNDPLWARFASRMLTDFFDPSSKTSLGTSIWNYIFGN